jgi:tetratricopeptide (TPR) repeat protein
MGISAATPLAVCLLLFQAATAAPQEQAPWERAPFEADPKDILAAARAIKVEEGSAVVLLFSESKWTFQADGRAEQRTRSVYRVLTEEGTQDNSAVRAGWSPWYQERPTLRARVISADGVAHPLNLETLAERAVAAGSPDVYTDRRTLSGPLPAMAPGVVVEIETTTRQTKPFFDRGVVHYHHFGVAPPSQRERLIVDAPDTLPLKHVVRLLPDMKPRTDKVGGRILLTFEGGPFATREAVDPLTPGDVPVSRYVAFTTGESWGEIAERYHKIVETQIADADLAALGELPANELPRDDRIARILALIQSRVRYTSLALGEASIVPRPPAETLTRRYGDCKDKSALLVAALRKAGIPANVALLLTGPGPDVDTELPGLGAFDHAIVQVPGSPALWIDPTDKFARPGTLPLEDQDRLALIAAPATSALIRTPASTSRDNFDPRVREYRLADFGPGRVVETLQPTGAPERFLRQWLEQDRKSLDQTFKSYMANVFISPKAPTAAFGEVTDLTKPMELRFEAVEVGRVQTDLREAVVGIPLEGLWKELPWFLREEEDEEKPAEPAKAKRVHDIVLHHPSLAEWRFHIVPPAGYQARPLPKSEKIPLGPALFEREFTLKEDGSVSLLLRFDCVKRRMTADEGRALRTGISRIRAEGLVLIGFSQRGEAHLEAGRIREALAEFRTLAEAEPGKALPRVHIARALLAGGLGDAARGEARKAVEIEPGILSAHQSLGWVLQHDLIGRRFEKGWDPKGAEAAYRAGLALQPGHLETTLDLAILLEHDADGLRYSPGAKVGAAIDLYRGVQKEIAGTQFENNLNIALMWAERFPELTERLKGTATPLGRVLILVAKASVTGADAALAHAARTIAEDEARRSSLAQAGELLLKLRRYPEAAALLSAAARGAADAANQLGRADRLRRTRRWEAVLPDANDAPGVVKRLLSLMMTPELDVERLKPLLSRHAQEAAGDDDDIGQFRAMHAVILSGMKRQGIPLEVVRDLTLSLNEPVVEGDEKLGYRVRVPSVMGGGGTQNWYLHAEDGRLRILGGGDGDIGKLVLDLLEAGDNESARKWLDWAADELPEGAGRDPLESAPFAVLWKKGKGGDVKALRRAGAALATGGSHIGAAIKILEEARKEESQDAKLSFVFDHALAQAFLNEKRYEDAAAAALRMVTAEPDAELAYYLRRLALQRLRKWDDMVALCEEQLRRKPDSPMVLYSLQHIEMSRGRQAASQEVGRRLIKLGESNASVYNNLAWAALLEGKATEKTLQDAQQSVMNSKGQNGAYLHTMATVYADLGRPTEARDVLLQTFRSRVTTEPEPHDWYVLGRIAEEYGARDAALAAYRRTALAKDSDLPNSTNQLSLRRLRLLGEK